jgi:hypothetical protein
VHIFTAYLEPLETNYIVKMKRIAQLLLFVVVVACVPHGATAQKKKKNDPAPAESAKPAPAKKTGMKSYSEVITKDAQTDEGLITIHKVEDKYFFEVPNELLNKEILVVSRISGHVKGLNFGGAGMKSRPQQVIRFQRLDNQILMRSVSYNSVAEENEPIYTSVRNNNFEPIITTFKIETIAKDSSSVVFDVNSLFTDDVEMIGALSSRERQQFKIKGLDKSRSLITGMKSFPENVIINHILTYRGDDLPDNQLTGTLSIGMTQSLILLPSDPMVPRYYDERVGYFSLQQIDYSSDQQKAATRRFITKWRLEPKDWDAYNRGELVEPVKPIVYYIDPATPTKWAKYIKQGVDDWQSAFEKAGFKNAIRGEYAPTPEQDPDWSPEDVRYSVIRYIATDIQNAQGPHVHDPRTGEILESDILWYHNVMNLLRNWFFIQTAAVNPEARSVQFDDALMGELIRFVAAHEVGHTLGLPHNMGSSVAYPVDSLRSPSFTATHGVAPSIMDYARFNYIAQPGDGVTNFFPRIGEYDDWSIEYGYRMLPNIDKPQDEKEQLNQWVLAKAGKPEYRYGRQRGLPLDPTAQTEDLGDDSMNASELGIANLKRIREKLMEWATTEGKNYEDLQELYANIVGQYNRYMGHVSANIGGVTEYFKTAGEEGTVYTHATKDKQSRAVAFLNKQLFETPTWIIDGEILGRIESDGNVSRIRTIQTNTLNNVLSNARLLRMIDNEAINGRNAYTVSALFSDLRGGIWSELRSGKQIDIYRRNLQKAHIDRLAELLKTEEAQFKNTDIPSIARANMVSLQSEIKAGIGRQTGVSADHLRDALERIKMALEGDK